MVRIGLFWLFAFLLPVTLHAQIWHNVGNAGFSVGIANYTSLKIDSMGFPYLAYQDGAVNNKATVMHYDGARWQAVGVPGISAGAAYYVSFVLSNGGVPYIAYQDAENDNKVSVMKYDGTAWSTVGRVGFSSGQAYYTSLAIDASGTPYVAFQDYSDSAKATVMKFDGSAWILVGTPGFSAGQAGYTNIAINSQGQPYVIFEDFVNNHLATVMTFDGTAWVNVGNPGFSGGTVSYTTINIGKNDVPYVAFNQAGSNVFRFNGSGWTEVGFPRFSGLAAFNTMAITDSGQIFVAGADISNSSRAFVSAYDSSSFQTFRTVGGSASVAAANYVSLALDKQNVPYIAYSDEQNGYRASVMQFSIFSGIDKMAINNDVSIYPNPSSGHVTITSSESGLIQITDIWGQTIRSIIAYPHQPVSFNNLPAGIYFVISNSATQKLVIGVGR